MCSPTHSVSIPQSGFGAFELVSPRWLEQCAVWEFQSLSRDSGRLNKVSVSRGYSQSGSFNPSVGIRGV